MDLLKMMGLVLQAGPPTSYECRKEKFEKVVVNQ